MLLIDLINSLMPLSQGLLRASYIFKELKEKEFLEWCNKELNGYEDRENVPKYRKIQGRLCADEINGFILKTNITIPMKKDDENLSKIATIHNGNSISTLENLLDSTSDTFSTAVPVDNYWVVKKYFYGNIQNLRVIVHKSAFENIIASVKKELIDILYNLSKQYGNLNKYDVGKKKMKKKESNITNNNISFGNNTKISNSQVGNNNINEDKSKSFLAKHPVISTILGSLAVALIVATKYWKAIENFLGK